MKDSRKYSILPKRKKKGFLLALCTRCAWRMCPCWEKMWLWRTNYTSMEAEFYLTSPYRNRCLTLRSSCDEHASSRLCNFARTMMSLLFVWLLLLLLLLMMMLVFFLQQICCEWVCVWNFYGTWMKYFLLLYSLLTAECEIEKWRRGWGGGGRGVSWFGCLSSQQHASVSQGWIYSDSCAATLS